jgi:hypothetical protein
MKTRSATPEEILAWGVLAAARKLSGSQEEMPLERELMLARAMRRLADPKGTRFRDLKTEATEAYEMWVESVREISSGKRR